MLDEHGLSVAFIEFTQKKQEVSVFSSLPAEQYVCYKPPGCGFEPDTCQYLPDVSQRNRSTAKAGRLRGLVGSALDHGSLPPEFESRRGHI